MLLRGEEEGEEKEERNGGKASQEWAGAGFVVSESSGGWRGKGGTYVPVEDGRRDGRKQRQSKGVGGRVSVSLA